ncbi:MAG: lipopolysaccharide biosynthesis protein [Prevotella sp.]|nr:lipopolysaccharide biosynthesis protein [Candidatus Prevotella equi]
MSDSTLKEKTAKGLLWGGLSNGIIQLLGALFGIVLLRLLTPDDYGKIAVLLIFSSIASNLQESGFVAALVNRKEPTHEEYNAVFWFNVMMSVCLYGVLWFASPLIAAFYHEPILTPLARYLFLGFLLSSFGIVQRAYLMGHLMVKQTSIINIAALVLSNVIGVTMAYLGYAFWGLATQSIMYVLIVMLLNWYASPWRPTLHINLQPAWKMFGFSSKLLITNLFNQLNTHVFSILLGRFYNTRMVGFYSNARKWDDMATNTIHGMMNGVSQPVLAQVVGDDGRYHNVFRKMLRFVSFVAFPAMFGLAIISEEFIHITVGDKWMDSAVMLSLLCIHGAFYPITMLYSNMAISRGRSGVNMFCTIAQCVIIWLGLLLLPHDTPESIYVMIAYFIIVNVLWLFVWQWFAWRMIRLSLWSALKDVMPFLCLAAIVMAATYFATQSISNVYLCLTAKIIMAALMYVGLTWLSGARILRETIDYLLHKRHE